LDEAFKTNRKVQKPKKEHTLSSFIAQFVQDVKDGKRTYTTKSGELKKYSTSSAKEYRLWQTQWKNFKKSYGREIQFEDVNLDLYDEYVDFFIKKDYTTNSIGKQVKNLKSIMNSSYEEGLHNNLDYKKRKFKTLKSEVDNIALTKEELKKLFKLKLTKKPNYKLVRDVFLIGCYTALRYSDFSRIKPKHIKGNFIEIITRKTNKPVRIPMRKEVKTILARYKNHLPKTYEQKVNLYIKEVAKIAGITDPIEIRENKGGKSQVTTINKNELIKTHTARRTGATLMHLSGISAFEIMSITGHTSEKNLLKYIKVTQKEISEKLANKPFFNGL
jgi:integrase